jgi:hypothetical protein
MSPPPPLPLSFGFPAQQPLSPSPISLSLWCPRAWRRRSLEFGPRGELPSPPFSYPLPPLSTCAPPSSLPCARASLHGGATPRPAPPLPSPARARPLPSGPRWRSAPPLPFPVWRGRGPSPLVPGGARPLPFPPRPAGPLLSPLRRRSAHPCSPAPRRVSAWSRLSAGAAPARSRARPLRGARPRAPAVTPQCHLRFLSNAKPRTIILCEPK